MYRNCEPAVCRHIKYLGTSGPPFCNHYSYKFNFVKSIVLGELQKSKPRKGTKGTKQKAIQTSFIQELFCAFCAFLWLNSRGFDFLDQRKEGVDVDRFGDEGEIADREGAFAVLFAGVTRDRDRRNVGQSRQDS
jgi:hypothetical protein